MPSVTSNCGPLRMQHLWWKKKKTIITFFPDAQPEKKLPTPGVGFKRQRLPAVPSDGSEQPLRIRLDRKCMARKEWCQQVPGTRTWLHYLPPRTQRQMSAGHVLRPTSRDLRGTLGPQTTLRQSINEKKNKQKIIGFLKIDQPDADWSGNSFIFLLS